jgi:NADPH2:quinone reductase
MRAILCTRWGGPEGLELGELPEPQCGSDQVLIRPHAWGVNFADLVLIGGSYHAKPPLPFAPGMEIAGEIVDTGAAVGRFRPGDRVAAYVETGGYADLVAADNRATMRLPDVMDWTTGAAFPVTYGTAYVALVHRGRLAAGESLMVLGAAGGVGLAAVEVGRLLGARVIACASTPEKLAVAAAHGAEHLVEYTRENLRDRVRELTLGRGADVIYDPVGGDAFDAALRCIAFEGRILVIGFASGRIPQAPAGLVLVKGCSVVASTWTFTLKHRPEVIERAYRDLAQWYEQGALRPRVSQTLPFESAPEALRLLAGREALGKVVLVR